MLDLRFKHASPIDTIFPLFMELVIVTIWRINAIVLISVGFAQVWERCCISTSSGMVLAENHQDNDDQEHDQDNYRLHDKEVEPYDIV